MAAVFSPRRGWRIGRIATLTAVLASAAAASAPAADQVVYGVVAPIMGIGVDASGHVHSGGTVPVQVNREWRGTTLIVTVVPR